jgi:hypothetical protein
MRQDGLIEVRQKNIRITDPKRLRALAARPDCR